MKLGCALCVLVALVGCSEDDPFRHLGDAAVVVDTVGNVDLTIAKAGNGHGSVGSTPAGIACGASCTASFMQGTTVTLGALADDDSEFTGWSGACTGTAATCEVTLAAATSVTATFKLKTHTVTLTKQGPGTGAIQGDAIDCTDTCTLTIDHGTTLSLSAVPMGLSVFAGWGGACSGTGACSITVTSDVDVSANFALDNFTLFADTTGTGTGTVTSSPAGIDCGSTCSHTFTANQMVTLTATPATGSSFTGWTGGGCSGTGTCLVTIDGAKTVTAAFTLNQYAVTVTKTGMGTVVSTDTDINCGTTCTANYDYNSSVTLTAVPATGWVFSGWGGACSGTNATCTLTVDQVKNVTATFTITTHALTVTPAGTGTGTVTGTGINCGATCSNTYSYGTSVTLTAAAATGSTFAGWMGACTGTGTCTVTMDAAKSVTATFTLNTYTLDVTKTGNGTVTSTPAGISCGATCSASFNYNTAVALTATAATGYTFTGWGGACTGTGACNVTMDAAKTVTATFTINTYALSVSKTGNGTITSVPAGISCGATCSASFNYNTSVALTATAATGYTFTGWGGACTGTGACNVTMDAAKSVTATFTINTYALTVSKTGNGTVTSVPAGISCGANCNASFNYNTSVALTATAATGYTFTGWGGACSGTGACNVTMDAAKSVTATFTINTYMLGVSRTGSGTVTSAPAGINCGAMCAASFNYNTVVALTPAAATGWTFTGWGGACTGTGACNVTMDAAKNVTATFTINQYALTVSTSGTGVVTSTPSGISCGAQCTASFDYNTVVSLSAGAASGYTFTGWGGACSGTGPCNVTMDAAKSVTATFTANTYTLSVSKSGSGTVTSSPSGISCGATCSATFTYPQSVTLSAAAGPGYTFTGWGGACAGTGSCTVTMDASKSVSATFTANSYTLTVSKTGNGTVTSMPSGISCGATCSASFTYPQTVSLSAVADPGYTFTGWGGACTGTGACSVTMDAAKTVTATFTINSYSLTVTNGGNGLVQGGGVSNINCGSQCTGTYTYGTSFTLTATPNTGYHFAGWSGDCTGTGNCLITMNGTRAVTATFAIDTYALTVSRNGTGTGTVTGPGIDCGLDCNEVFNYSTTPITLTASADPGSMFTGWSGACSGTGNCQVTMTAARDVTATFAKVATITLTTAGTGSGIVGDGTVSCSGSCTHTVPVGTVLTLSASPESTNQATLSDFIGWSVTACGSNSTCGVTVNSDMTVSATFRLKPNYMFVTSGTYDGNLNGVAGADKICQTLADSRNLGGTYQAYLSYQSRYDGGIVPIVTTVNAPQRFTTSSGWIRVDGKPVANSIDQMHQGTLFNPPLLMENGVPVTATQTYFAWTGTNAQGTFYGDCYLNQFPYTTPWAGTQGSAMFGNATSTSYQVVQQDTFGCTNQARLYCFGVDRQAAAQ